MADSPTPPKLAYDTCDHIKNENAKASHFLQIGPWHVMEFCPGCYDRMTAMVLSDVMSNAVRYTLDKRLRHVRYRR